MITPKINTQYFSLDLNYQFGDLSQQTWLIKFGHQRSFVTLHGSLKQTARTFSIDLLCNQCFVTFQLLFFVCGYGCHFLSQCNVFVLSCACVVLNMSVSLFLNLYSRVISVKGLCKWECFLLFSLSRLVCLSISITFFLSAEILFMNKRLSSTLFFLSLSISILSSFSRDLIFEQVFFLFFSPLSHSFF